jgi:hypothetical protein
VQVTQFQAYWDQVNADGGVCELHLRPTDVTPT